MKKATLLIVILIIHTFCFSQRTAKIDNYTLPGSLKEESVLVMEMPFGKADILAVTGDSTGIAEAADIFIDVICTDYPSHQSLSKLNSQRLQAFYRRFPFVPKLNVLKVSCFRQMDGAEREKAISMFHGLVIRYRPKQSAATMRHDIAVLDEIITDIEEVTDTSKKTALPKENRDSIIYLLKLKHGALPDNGPAKYETKPWDMSATGYDGIRRNPRDSQLIISPKAALHKGLISKAAYKAYDWTPWVTLYFRRIGDTLRPIEKPVFKTEPTFKDTLRYVKTNPVPDSTLLKILARNQWKNYSVTGDVTVSMYPYTAQLLLWIRQHGLDNVASDYCFFNDGNDTPNSEKKIGSTGGIYTQHCETYEEVKALLKETMAKGDGGDLPENDIEALIASENKFPQHDFQVLIADNRAPVKDLLLVSKLKKPVRIVLCGANDYNISADYLTIARKTKGSVHLMEKDITDLSSYSEGETMKIGKKNYKIQNDIFTESDANDLR